MPKPQVSLHRVEILIAVKSDCSKFFYVSACSNFALAISRWIAFAPSTACRLWWKSLTPASGPLCLRVVFMLFSRVASNSVYRYSQRFVIPIAICANRGSLTIPASLMAFLPRPENTYNGLFNTCTLSSTGRYQSDSRTLRFKRLKDDSIEVRHHAFVQTGYDLVEMSEPSSRVTQAFRIMKCTLESRGGDVE